MKSITIDHELKIIDLLSQVVLNEFGSDWSPIRVDTWALVNNIDKIELNMLIHHCCCGKKEWIWLVVWATMC
jgi:hypothetical protein